MASNNNLSVSLYYWAKGCDEKKEQLRDWLNLAILELAGDGRNEVASTQANGVAVAFRSSSMSLKDWIDALTEALQMLDGSKVTRTQAYFG